MASARGTPRYRRVHGVPNRSDGGVRGLCADAPKGPAHALAEIPSEDDVLDDGVWRGGTCGSGGGRGCGRGVALRGGHGADVERGTSRDARVGGAGGGESGGRGTVGTAGEEVGRQARRRGAHRGLVRWSRRGRYARGPNEEVRVRAPPKCEALHARLVRRRRRCVLLMKNIAPTCEHDEDDVASSLGTSWAPHLPARRRVRPLSCARRSSSSVVYLSRPTVRDPRARRAA